MSDEPFDHIPSFEEFYGPATRDAGVTGSRLRGEPDDDLHAVWSGSFRLFGVEVLCDTLSNGDRVIRSDSLDALLVAMESGSGVPVGEDILAFTRWREGEDPDPEVRGR